MRIAYIAPYHGPALVRQRPIGLNRSLANSIKLELIAGLLRGCGHEVEVISQGEVIGARFRYYRALAEPLPGAPDITVFYASALPIRRLAALWSSVRTLNLFKRRHRADAYDAAMIWNLKEPQALCGAHALRRMRIPVVLQYEDDMRVDMWGRPVTRSMLYRRYAPRVFREVSGGMACSPLLLEQLPAPVPKLLLRGVVGHDLAGLADGARPPKQNHVLFSGTHDPQKGIGQLISAWARVEHPDWELHITGEGPDTAALRELAANTRGVRFHGLVDRPELVRLMSAAKICVNPHDLSDTPGNLFAFKIVEYLAAGAHVLTTPMGPLEADLEAGITYLPDNRPDTIAAALDRAIQSRPWERNTTAAVLRSYGPAAVSKSLDLLLRQAEAGRAKPDRTR